MSSLFCNFMFGLYGIYVQKQDLNHRIDNKTVTIFLKPNGEDFLTYVRFACVSASISYILCHFYTDTFILYNGTGFSTRQFLVSCSLCLVRSYVLLIADFSKPLICFGVKTVTHIYLNIYHKSFLRSCFFPAVSFAMLSMSMNF